MGLLEIFGIGVGLAMDAFAVSVSEGMAIKKFNLKSTIIIALYFGIFQTLMPVLGYMLGKSFENIISSIDHWIAFILLLGIGLNMYKESRDNCNDEKENENDKINFKTMLILSIATSIDALAVGITFGFLNVNLIKAVICIGIITFLISAFGVKIGNKFGDKLKNRAEIVGGTVLILIGVKILIQHLVT